MRFKLLIEYCGTKFVGWQRQCNGLSVQQCIEEAVFQLTGEQTLVQGAGRTDAGVHALGQTAHVDIAKDITGEKLRGALNHFMKGHAIKILQAEAVPYEFHARFSALSRAYVYKIYNRYIPSAIIDKQAWHFPKPLDIESMQQAAKYLEGKHDFTSFRSSECQAKSPIKTLSKISIDAYGDIVQIAVEAPSFLHNQVRIIVGTLVAVGEGKLAPEDIMKILTARNRKVAGRTAPAHGLYFLNVKYPKEPPS